MAKQVKVRLYTYKNNETVIVNTQAPQASQTLTNSQYLLTVTDKNIVSKPDGRYVTINGFDIVSPGTYKVQYDTNSNAFIVASKIIVGVSTIFNPIAQGVAENVYILKSSTASSSNSSDTAVEIFEFYLNPQHIVPNYKKLNTEIRTRGGWEVQHWGNALTDLQVQGISGGLHKVVENGVSRLLTKDESVTDSTAWQKLDKLKAIYDNDQSVANQEVKTLLGMNYYNRFFIGYFSDFTGPEADALQPYMIKFSFNFKVTDEKHITSLTGGSIVL